jgi:restriction system protein
MAIPDYQTIMLPLLDLLKDKKEHSSHELIDKLANQFQLNAEERRVLLPSGQQEIFNNRVGWALTHLKKACLIKSSRRAFYYISDRGLETLKNGPLKIDIKYLKTFKEFNEFLATKREKNKGKIEGEEEQIDTPEESLANAYQRLRNELADELLKQLKSVTSSQFEKIVIDVLIAMGYGGSREDARKALGRPHDEGIDGTIKEDPLGLEIIYIQAKQWGNTIGRPEIQKFAGALLGQRAKKGIFITTSDFSREAFEYPNHIDNKIILISGEQLVQFMINHNVGVSTSASYNVKKIDTDYFEI